MFAEALNPQIFVVDDEQEICDIIKSVSHNAGYSCVGFSSVNDFLLAMNPAVILLIIDLMMPTIDGIELMRILSRQHCDCNMILISGVDIQVLQTAKDLAAALKLNIIGVLQKPFRVVEIEKLIKEGMQHERIFHQQSLEKPTPLITKDEIARGLDKDEFIIYYQPQIDIHTEELIGLEALVRWQHPTYGMILPDRFISLAEGFGLIDQLGWVVTNKSLLEVREIYSNGKRPRLAINISPFSLRDLRFPDQFVMTAKLNNIDAKDVILEVTESGFIEKLADALDILIRLRIMQFNLSIDDFGTGYATIQQLKNVPATELKIDRSLVNDLGKRDGADIIITKTIEMGHELGMKVIAEGVETQVQMDFLRQHNCDYAQGYLISRPLPLTSLQQWLEKRNS